MASQEDSPDGKPRKDADRPSPEVEKRPTLTLPKSEEKGTARASDPKSQDDQGEDPGKVGLTGDSQPDLVPPGGVKQGEGGHDKPEAGGPSDPGAKKQ